METYSGSQITIDNILIVFDAETIVDTYTKPSLDSTKPIGISNSNNVIFMLTKSGDALSGQGGSELNFKASPSDIIRWRETTLERNTGYNVQLYEYKASAGGDLISTPTMMPIQVTIPVPNPSNPLKPTKTQKVYDYLWQSTVLDTGRVTYTFKFEILNRDGTALGYYSWDPFVTITP